MPKISKILCYVGDVEYNNHVNYSTKAGVFYTKIPSQFETLIRGMDQEDRARYNIVLNLAAGMYGGYISADSEGECERFYKETINALHEMKVEKKKIIMFNLHYTTENKTNGWRSNGTETEIKFDYEILYRCTAAESVYYENMDGSRFHSRSRDFFTDTSGQIPWTQEREDMIMVLKVKLEMLATRLHTILLDSKPEELFRFLDTGNFIKAITDGST